MNKERVRSPYGPGASLAPSPVDWGRIMFGKPAGLMYKLFDLGRIGLDDERIKTYRNHVGDLCRAFVANATASPTPGAAIDKFEADLAGLATFAFGRAHEQVDYFVTMVEAWTERLRAELVAVPHGDLEEQDGNGQEEQA